MSFRVDALQGSLSIPSLRRARHRGARVSSDPTGGFWCRDRTQFISAWRGCQTRFTTDRDKATTPNTAGYRGRYCQSDDRLRAA